MFCVSLGLSYCLFFLAVYIFFSTSQQIGREECLQNEWFCVAWDVKPQLSQSIWSCSYCITVPCGGGFWHCLLWNSWWSLEEAVAQHWIWLLQWSKLRRSEFVATFYVLLVVSINIALLSVIWMLSATLMAIVGHITLYLFLLQHVYYI